MCPRRASGSFSRRPEVNTCCLSGIYSCCSCLGTFEIHGDALYASAPPPLLERAEVLERLVGGTCTWYSTPYEVKCISPESKYVSYSQGNAMVSF